MAGFIGRNGIRVVIFDLDDTLYDSRQFRLGGCRAVALFLHERYRLSESEVYGRLVTALDSGQGRIFDVVLKQYDLYSKACAAACLSAYRLHDPKISLYPDAKRALQRYRSLPLYVVTDGNASVQRRKAKGLGVDGCVKRVFCTRNFGLCHEKPSAYCFLKIQKLEQVSADEIVYVGDNPAKDFVGIKRLGFRTIRLLRGPYREVRADAAHEADEIIDNLDQL